MKLAKFMFKLKNQLLQNFNSVFISFSATHKYNTRIIKVIISFHQEKELLLVSKNLTI